MICACPWECSCIDMQVFSCVIACAYMRMCVCVCYMCACVYVQRCMCMRVRACVYAHVYMCMCVCAWMCRVPICVVYVDVHA